MAAKRSGGTGGKKNAKLPEERKQMLSVAGLSAAVVGTLILGAMLQADPVSRGALEVTRTAPAPVRRDLPQLTSPPADPLPDTNTATPQPTTTHQPTAATEPAPRVSDLPSDLAARVERDIARLPRDAWVLQLLAACDPANVSARLRADGSDPRLHVLPAMLDDRACFRVCWGPYPGRDEAVAARSDLPPSLRALPGTPTPRVAGDLIP